MEQTKIDSLKSLSLHLPDILNNLSTSPQLALTAADDPILAIESLGFGLSAQLRVELQARLPFSPQRVRNLQHLSHALVVLGPQPENPEAKIELHRKLYEEWKATFEETRIAPRITVVARQRREKTRSHLLTEGKEDVSCLETSSPQLSDLRMYRHLRNGEIPAQSRDRESSEK
ncbi:hypothetical protein [Geomesophilobacter sediminis]|uniref:Uncharacterized protein n=1 Tax=Geomesophilobacter sediminis TaxID=2798584 RepID=A0A8J7LZC1_9BACT|nr:hypothetical protein [Geomesophilobacter sediminis]MBJ6726166.1 hypothetical protein [Geomesophilobacter sediminis]